MALFGNAGGTVPSVGGQRARRVRAFAGRGRNLKTRLKKIRRFEFAISEGSRGQFQEKRRREVADYVLGWLECADIVDEVAKGTHRVLIVEVWCGVDPEKAKSFCHESPHYVAGSFRFD